MDNLQKEIVFEANRKSKLVAYLLWAFFGVFSLHRFYAGRTKSGAVRLVMLLIPVIGWAMLALCWLADLFLIPGMINDKNMEFIRALNAGDRRYPETREHERLAPAEEDAPEPVLDSKRARMLEDLRSTGYRKERRDLASIYR